MTPQVFAQLLKDSRKQEDYFNSFLDTHKRTFENSVSIHFSAKIYDDIDVSKIFYDHFVDFVVDDLSKVKSETSFETWVYDMSERRIADIQPMVIQKVRASRRSAREKNRILEDFIREKETIIRNVVRKEFESKKYNGYRENIRKALIQFFFSENGADHVLREDIQDIDGWLYTCMTNLANRKRSKIEAEVGINPKACPLDDTRLPSNNKPSDEPSMDNDIVHEEVVVDSSIESSWVKEEINLYLKILRISHPQYAKLIYLKKIEGYSSASIAHKWGLTVAAVNNRMNEAMIQLVKVALPVIRERNRKMYNTCGHLVQPDYQRMLLKCFFEENKNYNDMASKFNKSPSKISEHFKSAIDNLKKIYIQLSKKIKEEKKPGEYLTDKEELAMKKEIGWEE